MGDAVFYYAFTMAIRNEEVRIKKYCLTKLGILLYRFIDIHFHSNP